MGGGTTVGDVASELVHKGVDPDEVDEPTTRQAGSRRRKVVVGLGVGAVLLGGVLVATRPWSSDDSAAPSTATVDSVPASALPDPFIESGDLPFVTVDDLPDGWVIQWVNDIDMGFGEVGPTVEQQVVWWKGAAATYSDGPWVSVSVQLLDRFERQSFDPVDYFGMGPDGGTPVAVGRYRGAIIDNWWGDGQTLLFGPVNDGFVVTVESVGLTEAELISLGAEIELQEDGNTARAVLGAAADAVGLEPFAAYSSLTFGFGFGFGGGGLPLGLSNLSRTATWGDPEGLGDGAALLVGRLPDGVTVEALAEFMFGDAEPVDLGHAAGFAGRADDPVGMGSVVVWEVEGALVALTSSLPLDETIAIARSARVTDDDEWDDLRVAAEEFLPDGDIGMPDETWLIGAGDTADSRTWLVEGALDDDGLFSLCYGMFSQFESSTGCSGDAVDVDGPALIDADNFDGAPGDQVYVAVAPLTAEGAVLRITTADGVVTEVVLVQVRPDWPFLAAAGLLAWDGEVELIGADGSVLDGITVTDDDLRDGGGNGTEGGSTSDTTAGG
ncbi:MAG TPA: hypothetical protein DCR14_13875 [Acidimicrobiaceae bacterium]|nr:hypothetical protein [Acidimicrobiaceae bacterium]